jgi:hypothetical protein
LLYCSFDVGFDVGVDVEGRVVWRVLGMVWRIAGGKRYTTL